MKNNRAALRYAKAALSIALDQGTADAFEQDMIGIVEVCSANKDFIAFLENPILSVDTKKETVAKVFTSLSEGSQRLVDLLATNNRINLLDQVAEQFIAIYQVQQGKQTVLVTTAVPLTATLENTIMSKAKELSSAKLTLSSVVDPSIIGGFILRIGDLQYNASVVQGRIHPARIEEVVNKTTKQIENEIAEVGKRTVVDLGIHGLNPALIKIIGRMKYRSSYGQNLLQHSREVAKLCGVMASELGLNPKLAKRAGLLHDIGKVPEEESELPHAILGMQWAEKYGEKPDVCNAIGAHHDEVEMTSLLSPIVQVCDAISGARPGARRQVLDSYIQRLKDLETIALDFSGVSKAYAIQAGRELRVIVESEKVSDNNAAELSFQISQKIQTDMTYPGQVKVTVIRETRAVNVAK